MMRIAGLPILTSLLSALNCYIISISVTTQSRIWLGKLRLNIEHLQLSDIKLHSKLLSCSTVSEKGNASQDNR